VGSAGRSGAAQAVNKTRVARPLKRRSEINVNIGKSFQSSPDFDSQRTMA
jgi:hypothetical protein